MSKQFILINLVLVTILATIHQCTENKNRKNEGDRKGKEENYTMADFKSIRKVDAHVHNFSKEKTIIKMARINNFRLFDAGTSLSEAIKLHYMEDSDIVAFSTGFSLEGWDDANWGKGVIKQLQSDFDNGASGVKIWKNIGMESRDKAGNLIVLDDPQFDPIFQFINDQGKVLLSHAGEPKNCWLPLDSMTVKNDREYFENHPEYHMYLHPEMPPYEEHILRRDNMLAKNPDLQFVGVHMATLEWSVDEAAKFLERFPNAAIDLAERISHTQYQSQRNREKVRDFFIKYQDRTLYGTDFQQYEESDPEALEKYMMETWLNDWKYFNTDKMVKVPQLDDPVQGLALPKPVVDKIYRLNAERVFPDSWKQDSRNE